MSAPTANTFGFNFDNSYQRALPGLYKPWQADPSPKPELLKLNNSLAQSLGLEADSLDSPQGARFFSGNDALEGSSPIAQAYAGHQFGQYNPQLGDGRALLLGEVITPQGERFDIQLKGSGPTPFSRGGDGKAALGPVLREYLLAEAMFHLGVPTTRALAAVSTGEPVFRERPLPGAILTRVASSHIRIGTFQYVAASGDFEKLKNLADYTISRHYPEAADSPRPYLALLEQVIHKQAALTGHWMSVGFVHGVMNTDNMTLAGETIDYGPCAFMDHYDPASVYSSIDRQGRYAYNNQASIAQWNLARLAETLLSLIDEDAKTALELAKEKIFEFADIYTEQWHARLSAKIGLTELDRDTSSEFVGELLELMQAGNADFTLTFRRLSDALSDKTTRFLALFDNHADIELWLERWLEAAKHQSQSPQEVATAMQGINPIYIPRNHKVEEALAAAVDVGNLQPFETLHDVLSHPFEEREGLEDFSQPPPADFGEYVTYCGT